MVSTPKASLNKRTVHRTQHISVYYARRRGTR
jgi:hypothetical protein